jgi:AcrR family transcriptional regulator
MAKKRAYHHGNLRQALVREAARTIKSHGVDALTLRAVGGRLGVSRTALYRHFSDKAALLAAVAREGFQRFRADLERARADAGGGLVGFDAMGLAYLKFALDNSAHYRVMFGGFKELCDRDSELATDAASAFQVLVDALAALQRGGQVQPGDTGELARFVWATSHGIAMLTIDGELGPDSAAGEALMQSSVARLRAALANPVNLSNPVNPANPANPANPV